jgi:hypothetical protein
VLSSSRIESSLVIEYNSLIALELDKYMVLSTEVLPKAKVPVAESAVDKESTPRKNEKQGRLRLRKAPKALPSSAVTSCDGDLASDRTDSTAPLHAPPSILSSPRGAGSSEVSRVDLCALCINAP